MPNPTKERRKRINDTYIRIAVGGQKILSQKMVQGMRQEFQLREQVGDREPTEEETGEMERCLGEGGQTEHQKSQT